MTCCVGFVIHQNRALAIDLAVEAATWLQAEGHVARVPASDASGAAAALEPWAMADEAFPDGLDVVVSIGGDGTMLRGVRLASPSRAPVLGVNVGHLGYLADVDPGDWKAALGRVLDGDFDVEERMTLDVSLIDGRGTDPQPRTALNDAVVEKLESGHTVRVAVSISAQPAISYAADGLIVATPTGSTAYNLSAGGPVVSPRLEAMLVTPVAAHSLFGRPLVVAPDEVVRVEVQDGAAVLGVDGQNCGRLSEGDIVECRIGASPARLITFGERDFWRVITTKFGLGSG
jgi:NAD+ kinase